MSIKWLSKMPDTKDRNPFSRLLARAVRILTMRDYSEAELRRKLSFPVRRTGPAIQSTKSEPETPSPEQIDCVVAWCYTNRYLDDVLFARRYVASQSRKGYGPQRIHIGLRDKGVSQPLIDEILASVDVEWGKKAYEVAERKFGLPLPSEWKEKAKVQRYLMTRGYLVEDIYSIFSNFDD